MLSIPLKDADRELSDTWLENIQKIWPTAKKVHLSDGDAFLILWNLTGSDEETSESLGLNFEADATLAKDGHIHTEILPYSIELIYMQLNENGEELKHIRLPCTLEILFDPNQLHAFLLSLKNENA